MSNRRGAISTILAILCVTNSVVKADDILLFAAASTSVALEASIHLYKNTSSDRVRASYASSGALARQLDNGAPASLFLSANTKWMDWAATKGLLAAETRTHLLRNRLVLIQHSGKIIGPVLRDLTGWLSKAQGRRLSIADPAHVPAGRYAKQALTSLGFWKTISPWTVRAQNVTAALLLVERWEAPFGIVYKTDVRHSKTVEVLATFPENTHPPILYDLAIVRDKDTAAARHFYEFLNSPTANKVFRRFGFLSP